VMTSALNLLVRRILAEDYRLIAEIARSLHPQWFTESALEEIARDIRTQDGFAALEKEVVGFATYVLTDNKTAELTWIGVSPELHRRGVGRALVKEIEGELAQRGVQSLQASTLAPTVEYEPYARTRNFYHAIGFSDVRIDEKWFPTGDDRLLLRKQMTLRRQRRILVAYFSYTGDTRRIAEALSERLRVSYDVETAEIVPTRKRSYLHWLAYSFVPNSEVDIVDAEIELSDYDAVLLGFPKWTFSCPPLNRFIHKLRNIDKPRFYLFMTCGGFDEQRFLDSLTDKLARMGCNVIESLTVKRKQIQRETYAESLDSFAQRIRENLR